MDPETFLGRLDNPGIKERLQVLLATISKDQGPTNKLSDKYTESDLTIYNIYPVWQTPQKYVIMEEVAGKLFKVVL